MYVRYVHVSCVYGRKIINRTNKHDKASINWRLFDRIRTLFFVRCHYHISFTLFDHHAELGINRSRLNINIYKNEYILLFYKPLGHPQYLIRSVNIKSLR